MGIADSKLFIASVITNGRVLTRRMHLNLESSRARVEQHTLPLSGAAPPPPRYRLHCSVSYSDAYFTQFISSSSFFYTPFLQVANFANDNEGQEGDDLSRTD